MWVFLIGEGAGFFVVRNIEFVRIKNIPFILFLRYLPIFLLGMVWDFLNNVKRRRMVFYFKAKINVLKMLPVMLKKRRCIMKVKRVSNKDLRKIIAPGLEWSLLKNKLKSLIFE